MLQSKHDQQGTPAMTDMNLLQTIQATISDLRKFQPTPSQEQVLMYTYTYDPYYQTLVKKEAVSGRRVGSLSIPLQDLYDVMKAIEKHIEKVDMKVN